jgi:hypothetical protein
MCVDDLDDQSYGLKMSLPAVTKHSVFAVNPSVRLLVAEWALLSERALLVARLSWALSEAEVELGSDVQVSQ